MISLLKMKLESDLAWKLKNATISGFYHNGKTEQTPVAMLCLNPSTALMESHLKAL